jgi:hypothetical protein
MLTACAPLSSASSSASALHGHACAMVAATAGYGHTEVTAADLTLWHHLAPPLLLGTIAPPGATTPPRHRGARYGWGRSGRGPAGRPWAQQGRRELAVAGVGASEKAGGGLCERSWRGSKQCSGSGCPIRRSPIPNISNIFIYLLY